MTKINAQIGDKADVTFVQNPKNRKVSIITFMPLVLVYCISLFVGKSICVL